MRCQPVGPVAKGIGGAVRSITPVVLRCRDTDLAASIVARSSASSRSGSTGPKAVGPKSKVTGSGSIGISGDVRWLTGQIITAGHGTKVKVNVATVNRLLITMAVCDVIGNYADVYVPTPRISGKLLHRLVLIGHYYYRFCWFGLPRFSPVRDASFDRCRQT